MNEKIENVKELVSSEVTRNRKRLMGFGTLSLIFGIVGIFMSTTLTITSVFIFGVFVVVIGFIFLIEAFSAPQWKGRLLNFLLAILYIIAGIIMVLDPSATAVWFTLFIAAFLIIIGGMRIITGFKMKDDIDNWGWIIFSGLLTILLGVMIYAQWPESGLWVIGLFISVELIMQGINTILLSKDVKKVQEKVA